MSATRRGPCPQCDRGPRDTALSITTDERGTVAYCHRCGYTASQAGERRPNMTPAPRVYRPWQDRAAYLWDQAVPIRGTAVETYLTRRGCVLPPPDGDLRYLPARGEHAHAMVARVTDAVTGEPISLHLTRLAPDGTARGDRTLLAGHRKQGGVIRLWPDEAVTYGLGVAEGIETALAAAHIYAPVWSCVDAGNLTSLPVLAGIDCLAIYADHDQAGIRAALACARRWETAGREVCVYRSRQPGEDIADMWARMSRGAA